MALMGIGEFAELSWLSPRALRLYDELGLLPPARVDPDSGYRWYEPAQLDQARLVSSLRKLDIPLAQIKVILALDGAAAAEQVASCWSRAEVSHAAHRDLAGYLIDRLNGKEPIMNDVQVRDVPARSLLCLLRHAHRDEIMATVKDLIARLHSVAGPRPGDPVSAPFVIFHGEVSEDSDGPVEVCWPVPDQQAAQIAAGFPDLTLRTEPAHQEAFTHPEPVLPDPAQLIPVVEGLGAWVSARHLQPAGGLRQIMIFNRGADGPSTDLEWAFPLRPAGR
jgi:DNA-binding transcriptional MerR regulator